MNSQIYCLPLKLGWNAIPEPSTLLKERREIYLAWKTPVPYFKTDLNYSPNNEDIAKEVDRRFKRLRKPGLDDPHMEALRYVNTTESHGQFTYPGWKKPTHSATLEKRADVVVRKPANLTPMDVLRDHQTPPTYNYKMWHSVERQNFPGYSGKGSVVHPLRSIPHDPEHERRRWDTLKTLTSRGNISYAYRRQLPGFAGHHPSGGGDLPTVDLQDNQAMIASTRAVHHPFPACEYDNCREIPGKKHQGPMSRMVTLTHPFNPFTQQTAYPTVGASGTQ